MTVVLSKQWRFLWTDLPSSSLRDESKEIDGIQKFAAAVHAAAAALREAPLERFDVIFRYDHLFASYVEKRLDFAAKRRVKEVDLCLKRAYVRTDRHTLPQAIYSNSWLTTLALHFCHMPPPPTAVEWRSLTQLAIHNTELTQPVIDGIVSGCPILTRALPLRRIQSTGNRRTEFLSFGCDFLRKIRLERR